MLWYASMPRPSSVRLLTCAAAERASALFMHMCARPGPGCSQELRVHSPGWPQHTGAAWLDGTIRMGHGPMLAAAEGPHRLTAHAGIVVPSLCSVRSAHIAACRQRGQGRALMVSVIWSVPFSEGRNRQAPTSASCMAAMACRALRFRKLGCRMGRLTTFFALARRFSAAARRLLVAAQDVVPPARRQRTPRLAGSKRRCEVSPSACRLRAQV